MRDEPLGRDLSYWCRYGGRGWGAMGGDDGGRCDGAVADNEAGSRNVLGVWRCEAVRESLALALYSNF